MRNAYALLGLSILIVLLGAYLIVQKAHAPTDQELITDEESLH